ncbi:PDR/VanB family oxidoreductase [Paraburkholderia oxyphila]|uniref:PDR/VanB family oxidoreductase n=1 Tax=Paraburkholderia oxyphila TaxID=614212 RepID=UPI0009FEC777|nr:PDR/VanB family oxidoreductase [Paraburkholderia oxyphila]
MNLIEVVVVRKVMEAEGIVSFELERPDGTRLPAFSPGAHIDVHIPCGLVRQYSLCNPSRDASRYRIAVLRDRNSRGGSEAMHSSVREGDCIRISEPRNCFSLKAGVANNILLAGGIGITPMMSMAYQLADEGSSFDLHYCTRTSSCTAFYDELRRSDFGDNVFLHVDDGTLDQRFDIRSTLMSCSEETHLYVCGPQGFMHAMLGTAREMGWDESRIHFEFFGATVPSEACDSEFEIQIQSSGKIVVVSENQTIASALAEVGIKVPMSCEQGVCGTCRTRVISGTPDHRDVYLTEVEREKNDQIIPCCSRSKSSRIVLDL